MSHHQVVIIGAGPAGLLLARMLANQQIDCVILENRNEAFLKHNNRGGFLEQEVAQLLQRENINNQIQEKGKAIHEIHFHLNGEKLKLSLEEETAQKAPIIYDQKNVVMDLMESLKADNVPIIFEAKGQRYEGLTADIVKIVYTLDGQLYSLTADYVAGCDGFRGISRRSIPKKIRQEVQEELPYAWLEWLVNKRPTISSPIIAFHPNGFAMQTSNANRQTRFYMQVERGTEMDDLPPVEEIWTDLETRLGTTVNLGAMEHQKLDYMRYHTCEPMQHGRLFIAGDAAHQAPRLGSKGINLALKDAAKLAIGFIEFYKNSHSTLLDNYSQSCFKENSPVIEMAKHFNQLFHKEERIDYTQKLQRIHQLLTDDTQKQLLRQYLIG